MDPVFATVSASGELARLYSFEDCYDRKCEFIEAVINIERDLFIVHNQCYDYEQEQVKYIEFQLSNDMKMTNCVIEEDGSRRLILKWMSLSPDKYRKRYFCFIFEDFSGLYRTIKVLSELVPIDDLGLVTKTKNLDTAQIINTFRMPYEVIKSKIENIQKMPKPDFRDATKLKSFKEKKKIIDELSSIYRLEAIVFGSYGSMFYVKSDKLKIKVEEKIIFLVIRHSQFRYSLDIISNFNLIMRVIINENFEYYISKKGSFYWVEPVSLDHFRRFKVILKNPGDLDTYLKIAKFESEYFMSFHGLQEDEKTMFLNDQNFFEFSANLKTEEFKTEESVEEVKENNSCILKIPAEKSIHRVKNVLNQNLDSDFKVIELEEEKILGKSNEKNIIIEVKSNLLNSNVEVNKLELSCQSYIESSIDSIIDEINDTAIMANRNQISVFDILDNTLFLSKTIKLKKVDPFSLLLLGTQLLYLNKKKPRLGKMVEIQTGAKQSYNIKSPDIKFCQLCPTHNRPYATEQFYALTTNSLLLYSSKSQKIINEFSYQSPKEFTCMCTTQTGNIAIGSKNGQIHLYKNPLNSEKTTLRSNTNLTADKEKNKANNEIVSLLISKDGEWLLATFINKLLLFHLVADGKSAFEMHIKNKLDPPYKLEINHTEISQNDQFTSAVFDSSLKLIISSKGHCLVVWDFEKLRKAGKIDYRVKVMPAQILKINLLETSQKIAVTMIDRFEIDLISSLLS